MSTGHGMLWKDREVFLHSQKHVCAEQVDSVFAVSNIQRCQVYFG